MSSLNKKLLLPLLLCLAGYVHGQTPTPTRSSSVVTAVDYNVMVRNGFKIPVFVDTTHALALAGIDSIGYIFKEYGSSKIWIRDSNLVAGGHMWTLVGTGGGSFYDSTTMQTKYRSDSARANTYASIAALQATLVASVALKKNITDSSVNSVTNYATQGRVRKLEDSLNAVIAGVATQLLDSVIALKAIQDTSVILRTGGRGDSIIRAAAGNIYTPGWVDSLHFHHLPNGDGTWSFYISDIPSGLFRFSDSICTTINGVRFCVLDSAGSGGGGSSPPFADNAAVVKNNADPTKLAVIDVSQVPTGTTNRDTLPSVSTMLAGLLSANTFQQTQTFYLPPLPAVTNHINLGSTSAYWENIYGNNIIAPGTFAFSVPTGANINFNVNGITKFQILASGQYFEPSYIGPVFPGATTDSVATDSAGFRRKLPISAISGGSSFTRQPITSGTSATGTSTTNTLRVLFNFTSTVSVYTFTMPPAPADGQIVEFAANGTLLYPAYEITTLTISPNSGQSLSYTTALTTLQVGEYSKWEWFSSTSTWQREQ